MLRAREGDEVGGYGAAADAQVEPEEQVARAARIEMRLKVKRPDAPARPGWQPHRAGAGFQPFAGHGCDAPGQEALARPEQIARRVRFDAAGLQVLHA